MLLGTNRFDFIKLLRRERQMSKLGLFVDVINGTFCIPVTIFKMFFSNNFKDTPLPPNWIKSLLVKLVMNMSTTHYNVLFSRCLLELGKFVV